MMKFFSISMLSCMTLLADQNASLHTFNRGDIIPLSDTSIQKEGVISPAYNASASVDLKQGVISGVALSLDASFLYWSATQEGLGFGSSGALVTANNGSIVSSPTSNGQILYMDADYEPAFKVGVGAVTQDWTLSAEYTWFHHQALISKDAPSTSFGVPVWVVNDMFEQTSNARQSLSGSHLKGWWDLKLDVADFTFSRPIYQGRYLTVTPFGGIRAAWIRQKINATLNMSPTIVTSPTSAPVISKNSSVSWAVGPRLGLESSILFPKGFRIQGDCSGSLLFSRYTIYHSETAATTTAVPSNIGYSFKGYKSVRPVVDAGIGLGWSSYFCSQKFHVDFLASYDFSLFFDQNVIRKFLDESIAGTGAPAGNLSFNGLTLKGQFDF